MLFLKKVTTATMGFTTRGLEAIAEANKPKAVSVLRVWGIVSGMESGTSQFGNYTKFKGEIAALNLVSGEEARSQSLLLPQIGETVSAGFRFYFPVRFKTTIPVGQDYPQNRMADGVEFIELLNP